MYGMLATRIGRRDVQRKNITSPITMLQNAFYKLLLHHNRLMRFHSTSRGLLLHPSCSWNETMTTPPDREALIKLTTEYWRLVKLAERTFADMQSEKTASVSAQLRYSMSRLITICTESGLKLVSYDREPYVPNLPVTIVNSDEASSFDDPVVDRTVEPTIIADGHVVSMGKVFLKKRV
jgi:hypothetical protein